MLFGLAITLHFGHVPQSFGLADPMDRLSAWRGR